MRLCDDTPITIASILCSLLFGARFGSPTMDGELELYLYIKHSLSTLYDEGSGGGRRCLLGQESGSGHDLVMMNSWRFGCGFRRF
jgi:hypothetical protein